MIKTYSLHSPRNLSILDSLPLFQVNQTSTSRHNALSLNKITFDSLLDCTKKNCNSQNQLHIIPPMVLITCD